MEKQRLHENGVRGSRPNLVGNPTNQHSQGETKEVILSTLQRTIGNRAVQRMLAQRSGDGPFDLDDDTTSRINRARGGGQTLDGAVQARMSEATGHDFSDVKVHTSPESDQLNQQLGAKAFTAGQDIFFREGAYQPQSGGGQELLAHELTHVVQQSSGQVGGSGGMTVNAPNDAFEQEADAVAKTVTSPGAAAGVQLQREEDDQPAQEEDELLQRQEMEPEEDELPE